MTFRRYAAPLLLLAAAPLWAAKAPAWTKGPDPRYPEAKYVHGVGVGTDIESARSNARAEISRVFQAKVQQTVKDVQTESSSVVGKKRGPALGSQSSVTNTELSTEGLLEGVVIKETWFDKKAKTYYALALLDKVAAQRDLAMRIAPLEETIAQGRAAAAQAQDPFARAKALAAARSAAVERDQLAARRRLVDPAGMADLGVDLRGQVEKDLAAALSKVRVQVDAGDAVRLRQKIAAQLSKLGLAVVEKAPGADERLLKLQARLTVEPFDRGHPQWKYYQWQGSVELLDPDAQSVGAATPSGSEGHLQENTAKLKTQDAGEDAVAQEAGRLVSQYVFGQ